jgi:RHS repeat-associated protein
VRYEYTPFGEFLPVGTSGRWAEYVADATSTNGPVTQMFTGKERDAETGLDYFGFRYMSAAQGGFTSPDPNSAGASLFDPQSWNAYSYVNNRPLTYVDPDGDVPLPVITGLGGAIIGGFASAVVEYRAQQALDPFSAPIWKGLDGFRRGRTGWRRCGAWIGRVGCWRGRSWGWDDGPGRRSGIFLSAGTRNAALTRHWGTHKPRRPKGLRLRRMPSEEVLALPRNPTIPKPR